PAHQVNGAAAMKARGEQRLVVAGIDLIAGDLLLNEAVIRLVVIERAYDVVAVAPGMGTLGVGLVAVGIGVADQVEPAQRPALPIVRGGEQTVYHLLICACAPVAEK